MKKRVTREAFEHAIEVAGGPKELFRLIMERKSKPGSKLVKDADGKYRYV